MKTSAKFLKRSVLILAILSLVAMILDSIALNFYTEQLLDPEQITAWEMVVISGALIFILFVGVSIYWISGLKGEKGRWTPGKIFIAAYGVLCVAFLLAEKVMAEEVGLRILNGLDFTQKLNNLQLLFAVQLIYVFLIIVELTAQDTPGEVQSAH